MLKRIILACAIAMTCATMVTAEDGYRHHGAVIAITPDGKLDLLAARNPMKVVGGVLTKSDGIWSFTADPKTSIGVVDFVVDIASLRGQKVRVNGGSITMAHGDLALYGNGAVHVLFKPLDMPKEDARFALKTCESLIAPDVCNVEIIGTAAIAENGSAVLKNSSIVRSD